MRKTCTQYIAFLLNLPHRQAYMPRKLAADSVR
jgi:hypothetical protein